MLLFQMNITTDFKAGQFLKTDLKLNDCARYSAPFISQPSLPLPQKLRQGFSQSFGQDLPL